MSTPPPDSWAAIFMGKNTANVYTPGIFHAHTQSLHNGVATCMTDAGINYKTINEDRLMLVNSPTRQLLICVDGMGGMGNGETAADLFCEAATEDRSSIDDIVKMAHEKMRSAIRGGGDCGVCFSAVEIANSFLYPSWAGDCRILVIQDHHIIWESEDEGFILGLVRAAITDTHQAETLGIPLEQARYQIQERFLKTLRSLFPNASLEIPLCRKVFPLNKFALVEVDTYDKFRKMLADWSLYMDGRHVVNHSITARAEVVVATHGTPIALTPGMKIVLYSDGVGDNLTSEDVLALGKDLSDSDWVKAVSETLRSRTTNAETLWKSGRTFLDAQGLPCYQDWFRSLPKEDNVAMMVYTYKPV